MVANPTRQMTQFFNNKNKRSCEVVKGEREGENILQFKTGKMWTDKVGTAINWSLLKLGDGYM